MKIENLYQEIILDHCKYPHNFGLRDPFFTEVNHINSTCGDEVILRVMLSNNYKIVLDISYQIKGCSISKASTSVLTDQAIGKSVKYGIKVVDSFTEMISSRNNIEGDENIIGDGIAFAGVAKYPARIKCALLSWIAFKTALKNIVINNNTAIKI